MIEYSYYIFTLVFIILSTNVINSINLNDLESNENLRIRKYPGYCINTIIMTASDDDIINQLVNNRLEIWNGFNKERMVEGWVYEKGEKILLIDLYIIDYNGLRYNRNIAFIKGMWREIEFIKFHLILRDLKLNSKPITDIDIGDVDKNYDPCREMDEIAR